MGEGTETGRDGQVRKGWWNRNKFLGDKKPDNWAGIVAGNA